MTTIAFDLDNARRLWSRPTGPIIESWMSSFGIDVEPLFHDVPEISLYQQNDSGLMYFVPSVIGDDELYEQLAAIDWYYLDEKWEYDHALSLMDGREHVLEVGCGRGAFLKKIARLGHDGVGLELNERALAAARQDGLVAYGTPVEQFAASHAGRFDRVASFQVLEHVRDPIGFLHALMQCAQGGGSVCVAVPNAGSFIRHTDNILDMPPHHASRWTAQSLEYCGRLIGAAETQIKASPLEPIHVDWFVDTLRKRRPFRRMLKKRVSRRILTFALLCGGMRFVDGHAIFAEFRKP